MAQVNQLYNQFNELYDQGDQLIDLADQLDMLFWALITVMTLWQIFSPVLSLTWPLIFTVIFTVTLTFGFLDLRIKDQAKQLYDQADQIMDLANHLRSLPGLDGDRTQ